MTRGATFAFEEGERAVKKWAEPAATGRTLLAVMAGGAATRNVTTETPTRATGATTAAASSQDHPRAATARSKATRSATTEMPSRVTGATTAAARNGAETAVSTRARSAIRP
jgi:hypothetical protein